MELVLLIGIPGSGKSTFCAARFSHSHVRLCRDVLRTRHREQKLFLACLEAQARVVIDNTNATPEERAAFIVPAREAGFRVAGYYLCTDLRLALERNALREGAARVPDVGVLGQHKRLRLPSPGEGFDALYYVREVGSRDWTVEEWEQAPAPSIPQAPQVLERNS